MMPDRQDSRVAHLANLLLWEGRISRSRLIELHGLSQVRASEWLRELRDRYPDWVRWDSRARAYFATEAAYRAASSSKSAPSHGLVRHPYLPVLGQFDGLPASPNAVDSAISVLPWSFTGPSPKVFATIRLAIEERGRLQFNYRSMGHPEPHGRLLEPHTLIQAGRRWHVRGFCPDTLDFRDYVLGRLAGLKRTGEPAVTTVADDAAWNTNVKVHLVAHPALSAAQQVVVGMEYFAGTSARVETCRAPLVGYFIQEVRAAIDLSRQTPPDYQLALGNVEECRPWMFPS